MLYLKHEFMKLISLWASLNLCKYLQATFVFFCASSVVQINLVNNDFIWSITYSSYCIVLIIIIKKIEFDMKGHTSNKVRKKYSCKSF